VRAKQNKFFHAKKTIFVFPVAIVILIVCAVYFQARYAENANISSCKERGGLRINKAIDMSQIEWDESRYYNSDFSKYESEFRLFHRHHEFNLIDTKRKYIISIILFQRDGAKLKFQNSERAWKVAELETGDVVAEYHEFGYGGNLLNYGLVWLFGGWADSTVGSRRNSCGGAVDFGNPVFDPNFPQRILIPGRY